MISSEYLRLHKESINFHIFYESRTIYGKIKKKWKRLTIHKWSVIKANNKNEFQVHCGTVKKENKNANIFLF